MTAITPVNNKAWPCHQWTCTHVHTHTHTSILDFHVNNLFHHHRWEWGVNCVEKNEKTGSRITEHKSSLSTNTHVGLRGGNEGQRQKQAGVSRRWILHMENKNMLHKEI